MSEICKQTLNLKKYFVNPIAFLNLWVTLSLLLTVHLSIEIIRDGYKEVIPNLEEKMKKLKAEKKEIIEDVAESKYQAHKDLGDIVGIMPENQFYNESEKGFSEEIRTLGRTVPDDLWLSSFSFSRKKNFMQLVGQSTVALNVHTFISALEDDSALDEYKVGDFVDVQDQSITNRRYRRRRSRSRGVKAYSFSIKNYK